jgi:hypothetical protein
VTIEGELMILEESDGDSFADSESIGVVVVGDSSDNDLVSVVTTDMTGDHIVLESEVHVDSEEASRL